MIIGKFICSSCGRDCTPLYGFIMQKRTTLTGAQVQAVNDVHEEFGKDEFVFCWSCTAKAFGAKTLAEKEKEKNEPVVPKAFKEPLNSKESK